MKRIYLTGLLILAAGTIHGAILSGSLPKLLAITEGKISEPAAVQSLLKTGSYSEGVPTQISVLGEGDSSAVERLGGKVQTRVGKYFTAIIPTARLREFEAETSIHYLRSGAGVKQLLNQARPYISADQTYYAGYRGNDVIVGFVDSGIDIKHPDFTTENGLSRILYIWDQNDETGIPPSPFTYGRVWSKDQIDAGSCDFTDQEWHGTHVAGIAVGNGSASDGTYRGISPEANIIYVSVNFNNFVNVLDGVYFILDKASRLGKPCVINLSLGHQDGNHKASDPLNEYIDYLIDFYYANGGAITVWAAGNEGDYDLHTTNKMTSSTPTTVQVNLQETTMDVVLYYSNSSVVPVAIINPSGVTNIDFTQMEQTYSGNISLYQDSYSDTGDIEVRVSFYGSTTGVWKIVFDSASAGYNGRLDGYITDLDIGNNKFVNPVYDGTLSAPATQEKSIAVGAIASRTNYTNSLGQVENATTITNDRIVFFSSRGPTADNQLKPEVCAPGAILISAMANKSTATPQSQYIVNNYYMAMSGTSMAAPVVTGLIAQILEREPALSVEQIRQRLIQYVSGTTYKTDPGTWDSSYGYGVVSTDSVLSSLAERKAVDVTVKNNVLNFNSDTDNQFIFLVRLTSDQIESTIKARIINPSGGVIREFEQVTINQIEVKKYVWDGTDRFGGKVPPGVYYVEITVDNTMSRQPILVVE